MRAFALSSAQQSTLSLENGSDIGDVIDDGRIKVDAKAASDKSGLPETGLDMTEKTSYSLHPQRSFMSAKESDMPNRRIRGKQASNGPEAGPWDALHAICNRNFNVVTLINFLVMTAYYLIFVTTTPYARQVYAASLSTAGFTAGIMVIGCLAGRFLTGNLLSLFGCRSVLFSGLLLYVASMAAFFATDSLALLFMQRFFTGVGVGVIGTATGTIVAYVIPSEHRGFGVSLFSMSTALALALGPFLGIVIANTLDYAALMQINVGIALVCAAVFFGLGTLVAMPHRHRPFFALNSYIDPRVVRFSVVALIICLSYGCVQAFITSFAAERNLSGPASLFFLVYACAALATRPLTGRMFDTRGENVIFYPILLLTALSLFLLAHAHSSWLLLLSGLLLGAGFGNFQSVGQAVSLSLVSRSRFAQATTTFFIFFDLGIGLGPYLFGFLIPSIGYDGMYQALAVIVLCSLGLYYALHGKNARYGK